MLKARVGNRLSVRSCLCLFHTLPQPLLLLPDDNSIKTIIDDASLRGTQRRLTTRRCATTSLLIGRVWAFTCIHNHLPVSRRRRLAILQMDIRQWLQNTADREPPDECVDTGFPAFLQPRPDAAQPSRRSRQKRKRASSDPPVPARRPSRERGRPVQASTSDYARQAGSKPAATSSKSSSSSSSESRQSTVSGRRQVAVETFQKRARHKTRPDRYESKPKRRKKEHKSKRETKPESKRRKSHRSGDGARTTGLVQSFQLMNGPKNQRLTVGVLVEKVL